MKVNAYKCDNCGAIRDIEEMYGIQPVEDLFDKLKSYPHVPGLPSKMDKTNIHCCLECYRQHVLVPAENNSNRKKDEATYKLNIDNLDYILRRQCVMKAAAARKK